jgi:arsenate reductase
MSAALFNLEADPRLAQATSAGTEPGPHVHPVVVDAMRELGVDLAINQPQRLTTELAAGAALLVTMGCGDGCPYVAGLEILDWPLDDPKHLPLEQVRRIRDDIRARVRALVMERGWARA